MSRSKEQDEETPGPEKEAMDASAERGKALKLQELYRRYLSGDKEAALELQHLDSALTRYWIFGC